MAILTVVATVLGIVTGVWALIANVNDATAPPPKRDVSIQRADVGDRGDGLLSIEVDMTAVGYKDEELTIALSSSCSPDPGSAESAALSPLAEIVVVPRSDEESKIWPIGGPLPGNHGDFCVMAVQVADSEGEQLLDRADIPVFTLP